MTKNFKLGKGIIFSTNRAVVMILISLILSLFTVPSANAVPDNSYKTGTGDSEAVYLDGNYVQAGIAKNGKFGPSTAAPTVSGVTWHPSGGRANIGFVADRSRDGSWLDTDFFYPGTPQEGWGVDIGGTTSRFDSFHTSSATSQTFGDVNKTSTEMFVVHTTVIGDVTIAQRYSVPIGTGTFSGDQNLNVAVTITNNGASAATGVNYLRNVDPDNLQDVTGSFVTTNSIVSQYGINNKGYSLVSATKSDTRQSPAGTSYVGLFSTDSRSSVSAAAFGVPTPVTRVKNTGEYGWYGGTDEPYGELGYTLTAVGASATIDAGISMLFELGNLAAGASTSFNFSYVLSQTSAADLITSTPEVARRIFPSSYVMFAQNGADTNSLPQSELLDSTKALWKNIMTRAGYTFSGWNTKADGTGIAYADRALYKFPEPYVTLYAQWKLIQTKPTITWATPSPIQEGTALSETQLNAVGSVPGTYTYSPATSAVPAVGIQILKVTFVPTDPKYETVEASVEIEILAKAKCTWTNPILIIEGTALSSTQLNATASVPGSFVYEPQAGALLAPGKNTLKVVFTPTDTRLTPVTAEVVIDVAAKPIVIPAPPVEPTYTVTGSPKTAITWGAGKDAATYTVLVDGKSACSVAALTCDVAQLLGPNNVVTVTSVALSTKTSAAITARYVAPASSQVLTVVNFDTAKAIIKTAEAAKLRAFAAKVKTAGFTTLTVYGHTDLVGGIDNQKLSVARANAAITYLKKLLPGVTFVRSGFAASEPVGDNSTDGGKASNRRAEISIP